MREGVCVCVCSHSDHVANVRIIMSLYDAYDGSNP